MTLRMPVGAGALLATLSLALGALAALPAAPAQAATGVVFPVPTSNAGLSRIVTAPDGNMWFIERHANRVGRITPGGQVTEYPLPDTTTGEGDVMDLDIAPDGTLWVVYDSGWHALHVNPASWSGTNYGLGDNPYGGEVRVDPAGRAWITMNYDESGVAVVAPGASQAFWPANAPECDDVLGEAADGSMWCAKDYGLVHLAPDANSGTTIPLGLQGAERPTSLAAGPTGAIWFTSYYSGAWGIGTGDGEVGYVDQGTNIVSWRTGSRTAPTSLVAGPDGNMWFTMSAGAAKGIGHISPTGRGVVSAVGAYEPTAMTFGADGAVWFTDATNNSIVRVTTDQLQTNDVDLGDGVTMSIGAAGPGGGTPNPLLTGQVAKKQVPVRGGGLVVRVKCPNAAAAACAGTAAVQAKKTLTKAKSFSVKPGKTKQLKLKLTKAGRKQLAGKRSLKATVVLSGGGYSATKKVKIVR